jgi:hypothetical protein
MSSYLILFYSRPIITAGRPSLKILTRLAQKGLPAGDDIELELTDHVAENDYHVYSKQLPERIDFGKYDRLKIDGFVSI